MRLAPLTTAPRVSSTRPLRLADVTVCCARIFPAPTMNSDSSSGTTLGLRSRVRCLSKLLTGNHLYRCCEHDENAKQPDNRAWRKTRALLFAECFQHQAEQSRQLSNDL